MSKSEHVHQIVGYYVLVCLGIILLGAFVCSFCIWYRHYEKMQEHEQRAILDVEAPALSEIGRYSTRRRKRRKRKKSQKTRSGGGTSDLVTRSGRRKAGINGNNFY